MDFDQTALQWRGTFKILTVKNLPLVAGVGERKRILDAIIEIGRDDRGAPQHHLSQIVVDVIETPRFKDSGNLKSAILQFGDLID